ncbi:hypothetical protein ACLMJK_008147 [Lecanora helva]
MTGLERIDAFVFVDVDMQSMYMEEPWVHRLFKLQRGPKGLRDLRIHTQAISVDYLPPGSPHVALPHPHTTESEQFDEFLQDRIREGAEDYEHEKRKEESAEGSKSASES